LAAAVEVTNLSREYTPRRTGGQTVTALDQVSLSVEEGETLGLLGPNGAGKTTMIKVLATVLLPTTGTAKVLGHDVIREGDKVRPVIGLVFGGDRGLYTRVSARENLLFWAALYHISRREAARRTGVLLDRFGLSSRADEPVERFSRGMKQRLHLARGLVNEPRVLYLDEPTAGLDPAAALELRAIIGELKADGRTILLATHDLDEAEALCDRVSLIDSGQIKMVERTDKVGRLLEGHDRIDFATDDGSLAESLRGEKGVDSVECLGQRRYRALTSATAGERTVLLRWLIDRGVVDVQTSTPSLEEVYLHVLGARRMNI
jgi:ABC-2 type transport system ATP-binding protein